MDDDGWGKEWIRVIKEYICIKVKGRRDMYMYEGEGRVR
jgi:hypothetical protein